MSIKFKVSMLALFVSFTAPAKADMDVLFQYSVIDKVTKVGIPGAVISDSFIDVNNGNKRDSQSCTTNENGMCSLKTRAVGSMLFSGYDFSWGPSVEKESYLKQKAYSTKTLKKDHYVIEFVLSKPDETIHTKKYYANQFTVKDDELEVVAMIDTSKAHKAPLKTGENLAFLRGFIDKKSGALTYQVYVLLTYRSEGFHSFSSATAMTPSGPVAVAVTRIDRQVDCASRDDEKKCAYQETLGVGLSESLVQELAGVYKPLVEDHWKFRVKGLSGTDQTLSLPYAEIAAFAEKMIAYSAALKK